MPIIDSQRRARELGRIRLGQVVPAKNGKTRPEKLDRFRFTSPSRPLLDAIAALYGGTVAAWTPQNSSVAQWEVITDATRVPVMVPPQPLTQWYELWSGGGCQRRCTGETEVLTDSPCLCAQADERLCQPTTRLNVVLSDVPGIGVWRVESHGWYAAMELPQVAEFLAQTKGYVNAWLALEERSAKRQNERTGKVELRRWMVPTLEVGITPRELLAGKGSVVAALNGSQPKALEAGPSGTPGSTANWHALAIAVSTLEEWRALWKQANAVAALDRDPGLKVFLEQRGRELSGAGEGEAPAPDAPPPVDDTAERAALWQRILTARPDTPVAEVQDEFAKFADGETFATADLALCREYAAEVTGGAS